MTGSLVIGPRAYATSEEPLRYVGELVACGASGFTVHDTTPARAVRLAGGSFWVDAPEVGDRVSLSILDPQGQTVSVYCDRVPVPPFQAVTAIQPRTTGLVPAGFHIRITYERASAAGCNLGFFLTWFEAD